MTKAIDKETLWASTDEVAEHLADVLRDSMPGLIYIESDEDEIRVISSGERSTGVFSLLVRTADIRVNDGK